MRIAIGSRKAPEIERATSSDKTRPVLSCAHLNVDKGRIEATDNYMAVVLPVEIEEGDTSGLIPAEALRALRKANGRHVRFSLACNGDVELNTPDGVQTWKRPEGQFPNLDQITPSEFSSFRVVIDPAKLYALAKALGADRHVLIEFSLQPSAEEGEDVGFFPSNLRPMRVTADNNSNEAWGILMPARIP